MAMYYIGWNPDGKIFDQSIDGETLKSPLSLDGVGASDVIVGWKKGLLGMKVGGVRELTIPSGYGVWCDGAQRRYSSKYTVEVCCDGNSIARCQKT